MLSRRIIKRNGNNGRKTILNVYFPDECVTICERFAADTLKAVIAKVGMQRVADACRRDLNSILNSNYVPLVTKVRSEEYGHRQHEVGNGWLVFTGTNTMVKKRQLDMLKELFHLNMRVAIV